jgi:hypothetical protein
MKWRVAGRDQVTGASIITTIEAATLERAGEIAARKGIEFGEIEPASVDMAPPQIVYVAQQPQGGGFSISRVIMALIFVAVGLLVLMILKA